MQQIDAKSMPSPKTLSTDNQSLQPLPPLPPRDPNIPVPKRALTPKRPSLVNKNPAEDQPTALSFRELNPQLEGTPQAFGGTAGVIQAPPPDTLPDIPMSNATTNVKQWVPGAPQNDYTDNPENISTQNLSVLNRNKMFTLSDYEKVMLGKEAEKLRKYGQQANFDLKQMMESQRFFNLSLADIAQRTVMTVIAIFVDILNYFNKEEKEKRENMSFQEKANQFAIIFLAKERIIYVGVFLVMLSALFMVVFLSS